MTLPTPKQPRPRRKAKAADPRCESFVAACYPFLRERMFAAAAWCIRLDRPKTDLRGQMMLFEREVA